MQNRYQFALEGLAFQIGETDTGFLDHVNDLAGGQDQIHIRHTVMDELFALSFHLLGGAGHDRNVEGGSSVFRIHLLGTIFHQCAKHLHRRLAGGNVL